MMRLLVLIYAIATCVAVTGCITHLQSTKPVPGGITHGVIYNLPELHYDIEVRRTLSRCPEVPDKNHDEPIGEVQFDISAAATPRTVAGPEIVIDYNSLSAVTKTTDFSLERYPTGILKSVNAKVDDRTADVAAQAFKAAVSVGKVAIGLPSTGAVAAADEVNFFLACSPNAKKELEAIPTLRNDAKTKEAALKKATKALSDFEAANPTSPRPADVAAQITDLVRARIAAQEAMEAANKSLADSLKAITIVSRFIYIPGDTSPGPNELTYQRQARFRTCAQELEAPPEQGAELNGVYNGLADETSETTSPESIIQLRTFESSDDGKQQQWLIQSLGPELTLDCENTIVSEARWADSSGNPVDNNVDAAVETAKTYWLPDRKSRRDEVLDITDHLMRADILVTAQPLVGSSKTSSLSDAPHCSPGDGPQCGILYRTKMPGRLRICRYTTDAGLASPDQCHRKSAQDAAILLTDERSFPQLGTLASLSLRNGPFANNELSAEFSEDGTLTKMGYKKLRAEAVAVGETVNTGLDSLTTLMLYANGEELRDLEDQKKLNDARVALINSQTGLQQPSETTMLENEAGVLNARRELIEAEIALRKKQDELDAMKMPSDN